MKKLLSFLFLPALIITGCRAQQKTDNKSLLWRITGKGLTKPSYLFGTIHLLCPDDYIWTPVMQRSLSATKEVCFEMDMDDPSVMMEAAAGMMDAAGKSLREHFTEAQYGKLEQFVRDSMGIDLSGMQQLSPVMVQTLLMTKAVGCMIPVSYEANIMELAHKEKMEITGLEEVKEQLAVLQSLEEDSVISGLMQMTDSFAAGQAEYRQLVTAYKHQDLPALDSLIRKSKELGDDLGAFLYDRNAKWIPRMAERMKQRPVFFAVGAGHLWGEKGVIQLLRAAGYVVEPVK